jgi:hypothetical protein
MADLFGDWEQAQAQGLEGNLGEGVNLAGLPNKLRKPKNPFAQQQIQENVQEQQAARRGGFATHNMHPAYDDFIDKFGPDAQANALQGMIGNTMQAYQDENDSRVAQEREMRRMQHEKEMKQMELDALIARLNAQQ